jgi:signal transduction histidine kinase
MATVAAIIAQNHDAVMRCWMGQARQLASARGLDKPALQNLMPEYLKSLSAGDGYGAKRVENHFATRLRQGYLATEIVEEFALLGRCIADVWASAPPGERPDPADVDRLRDELHRVSARVVEMFASHMREDEQTEKRYLRMLQDVATDALHRGTHALRERLPEVLELVMEATGTQGAAIMLRSGDHDLATVAATGALKLVPYVTALEGTSFAAAVARSEEPIALLDATTSTELEIPEALRRCGLHSLLATRLCSVHGLSGIMYVGITEIRPFAAREVLRLESLAQHLAVHLENASLVADLSAKIEALHVERSLRERFVSVLAHDLRGPLSSAKLAAQVMIARAESLEKRQELAVKIDRNLDRMDRMIRDLLDANRIRAGERLPLSLEPCDLGQIAREIAEEIHALHDKRIELDGEPTLRGIWSADELRRALWNLVTNAVKYGDPQRRICISLHRVDERARVAVHNWGPPIPPEDQATLFEPFTRARAATRSGRPGWGLGLALVRGCAEAHGGTISLESTAEAGTTFTLEIPLDSRSHQPAEVGSASAPAR